jgi:hypothetical protein
MNPQHIEAEMTDKERTASTNAVRELMDVMTEGNPDAKVFLVADGTPIGMLEGPDWTEVSDDPSTLRDGDQRSCGCQRCSEFAKRALKPLTELVQYDGFYPGGVFVGDGPSVFVTRTVEFMSSLAGDDPTLKVRVLVPPTAKQSDVVASLRQILEFVEAESPWPWQPSDELPF